MKITKLTNLITVLSIFSFFFLASCKDDGGGNHFLPIFDAPEDAISIDNPVNGGFIFVDLNGSINGNGTKKNPVNDINKGIALAGKQNKDVCVAAGVYKVNSSISQEIIMAEGVSLFGGYSSNEWERDVAKNVTTIQNIALSGKPSRAVSFSTGITESTHIDGFTIAGSSGGINSAAIFCDGGSPTISNNTIIAGGSGTSVKLTNAVYIKNAKPMISNNIIDGGSSDSESNGVFCMASNPVISNNTIEGGISEDSYSIKCYAGSSPDIQNNTLAAQGRISRFGIYEEQGANNNPHNVIDNVFSNTLLAPVSSSGLYRDYTNESFEIKDISSLNLLDSSGSNPNNSVSGNTIK